LIEVAQHEPTTSRDDIIAGPKDYQIRMSEQGRSKVCQNAAKIAQFLFITLGIHDPPVGLPARATRAARTCP
jgi:hypothetical protein